MIDFDSAPDFVNEKGVKWWREQTLCEYARSKGLKGISVWRVELPDGMRNYVVVDGGQAVKESQRLEDVGVWLDVESILKSKKFF